MKKITLLVLSIILFSCSSDNDEPIKEVSVSLNFTHFWDSSTIENSDLGKTDYTNQKGTKLKIERLRYLISRVTLKDGNDKVIPFSGYKLVDVSDSGSLTFSFPEKVSEGVYNLSFTFGFNKEDNKSDIYKDLNSADWNVPEMLGGGYHFMQLDGKFIDKDGADSPYNFHAIQAYNTSTKESTDTFFTVDLGNISLKNNATVNIKTNIAQWFKDPNEWNLNEKSVKLMMDHEAQIKMSENGKKNVFSVGGINQ